jgi:hypothetical protein
MARYDGAPALGMDSPYGYQPAVIEAVDRCLRESPLANPRIRKAPLARDLGGIDLEYVVNQTIPLQVRCRFNRPIDAPTVDIAFRQAEPRMIDAGTYAPLLLYVWLVGQRSYWTIRYGRLVDIYRMNAAIDPRLKDRPFHLRTNMRVVRIAELQDAGAELYVCGESGRPWVPAGPAGDDDLRLILDKCQTRPLPLADETDDDPG